MDNETLRSEVGSIVEAANLETCTLSGIMAELEARHGPSVHDAADDVRRLVDEALVSRVSRDAGSPLVREHTSVSDEDIARQLQAQEARAARGSRGIRTARKPAERLVEPAKDRKSESNGETSSVPNGSSEKRVNPFNKPLVLSPPLARLLGAAEDEMLSRPQVVKRIWAYVREHDLQDPANKRFFRCDAAMEAVFRRKRVECFAMNRFLSEHLSAPEEAAAERPAPKRSRDQPKEATRQKPSLPMITPATIRAWERRAEHNVPAVLEPILGKNITSSPVSVREITAACLAYARDACLFDGSDATLVRPNAVLASALAVDDEPLHVLDLIEAIRAAAVPL